MRRSALLIPCLAVSALTVAPDAPAAPASPAPVWSDPEGDAARTLLENVSGAIVTVKFVLRSSGGGGENEQQREVSGVMIEDSGLVLTSNLLMGGVPEAVKRRARVRNTAKDIKVLIDDDTEGVDAKLVARDSELDLAWVRIVKPEGKYKAVDFTKSASAQAGDRVMVVERLGRYHDRQATVDTARVRAVLSRPRRLFLVQGDISENWGLPFFNIKGEVIGLASLQLPSQEELDADRDDPKPVWQSVVLPASVVVRATEQAKESERAGKPVDEEPPAEDPAPADEPAAGGDAPPR
ncbi:MAG: trypsin-like peptidase domain-containing protein [Phycisphaeraceae bacterium]|nr:MAG: trypsin-like peptidase domain-containing protein [Phycisphaeraceae bacterium]